MTDGDTDRDDFEASVVGGGGESSVRRTGRGEVSNWSRTHATTTF